MKIVGCILVTENYGDSLLLYLLGYSKSNGWAAIADSHYTEAFNIFEEACVLRPTPNKPFCSKAVWLWTRPRLGELLCAFLLANELAGRHTVRKMSWQEAAKPTCSVPRLSASYRCCKCTASLLT